jgi:hypothetical protein
MGNFITKPVIELGNDDRIPSSFFNYQKDGNIEKMCQITTEIVSDLYIKNIKKVFGLLVWTDEISPCFMIHAWLKDGKNNIVETSYEVLKLNLKYNLTYITDLRDIKKRLNEYELQRFINFKNNEIKKDDRLTFYTVMYEEYKKQGDCLTKNQLFLFDLVKYKKNIMC